MSVQPGEYPETLQGNKRLVTPHLTFAKSHMENTDMSKRGLIKSILNFCCNAKHCVRPKLGTSQQPYNTPFMP